MSDNSIDNELRKIQIQMMNYIAKRRKDLEKRRNEIIQQIPLPYVKES